MRAAEPRFFCGRAAGARWTVAEDTPEVRGMPPQWIKA